MPNGSRICCANTPNCRAAGSLEIIDPTPFSEAEDRAVAFGLQKVPLDGREGGMFLGLVGTNTTDDVEAMALFFRPIASRSWNMIFRA